MNAIISSVGCKMRTKNQQTNAQKNNTRKQKQSILSNFSIYSRINCIDWFTCIHSVAVILTIICLWNMLINSPFNLCRCRCRLLDSASSCFGGPNSKFRCSEQCCECTHMNWHNIFAQRKKNHRKPCAFFLLLRSLVERTASKQMQ